MNQEVSGIVVTMAVNPGSQKVIHVSDEASLIACVKKVRIDNAPVLVVVGTAKDECRMVDKIIDPFVFRHLAPFLDRLRRQTGGLMIVTGGTQAGIMQLVGESIALHARECRLIGIAPKAVLNLDGDESETELVTPEPHHDFLITTPGTEFTDELQTLGKLVERLNKRKVAMLVLGGSSGTEAEVQLARRRGWPVICATDTGGAARSNALKHGGAQSLGDKSVRINCEARVASAHTAQPFAFGRLIGWSIGGSDLRTAWWRAAHLGHQASQLKGPSRLLFVMTLAAGVLTTGLSVFATASEGGDLAEGLSVAAASSAALGALLVSWAGKRRKDERWLNTRIASEGYKREIFRVRVDPGRRKGAKERLRAQFLQALARIEADLPSATPEAIGDPTPSTWPSSTVWDTMGERGDDGFSELESDIYTHVRVEDQIGYFGRAAHTADRWAGRWTFVVLALAAATTVLALALSTTWVFVIAVIAAAQSAIVAGMNFDQTERRVRQMSNAAAALRHVTLTWRSKEKAKTRDLVDDCERVLELENAEWKSGIMLAQDIVRSTANAR